VKGNPNSLLDQPPGAEMRSPMTTQLFDRLTQPADSTKRKRIDYTSLTSYTYTARKPLRRVLDHTLDHLNQIDQWQLWRRDRVVPTPTDGWAPSTVTLPEDRLPLTIPRQVAHRAVALRLRGIQTELLVPLVRTDRLEVVHPAEGLPLYPRHRGANCVATSSPYRTSPSRTPISRANRLAWATISSVMVAS
jgi:hypothetical protein